MYLNAFTNFYFFSWNDEIFYIIYFIYLAIFMPAVINLSHTYYNFTNVRLTYSWHGWFHSFTVDCINKGIFASELITTPVDAFTAWNPYMKRIQYSMRAIDNATRVAECFKYVCKIFWINEIGLKRRYSGVGLSYSCTFWPLCLFSVTKLAEIFAIAASIDNDLL